MNTAPERPRSGRLEYLSWTLISQALNAATNLLLTVQLARALSILDFSTAALSLSVLALSVAGLRGWLYEPAIIHGDLSRSSCARLLIESGAISGALALAQSLLVIALGGPIELVVILGAGSIAAVVQDAARFALIALDRPKHAALTDILWMAVQISVLVSIGASGTRPGLAWLAGGVAAALVGAVALARDAPQTSKTPRPTRIWQWGAEYVIASGSLQLAVLVVPLAGNGEIAGGLRGAASLLGVATVLMGGAQQAIVGRLRTISAGRDLWPIGLQAAAILGIVVSLGSLPLLFLPDSAGVRLLGETWPVTAEVLPLLAVQRIASAVAAGPAFVLRREAKQTSGVWWRGGLTMITVAGVIFAAAVADATAVSLVLALGAVASVPIWFNLLAGSHASFERGPSPTEIAVALSNDTSGTRQERFPGPANEND